MTDAPIIMPSCGRCYWIVKAHKDTRDNLPYIAFCGHPRHTAHAWPACPHKRELAYNEIPLATRRDGR